MAKKGGHWGDKGTKGDYISISRIGDDGGGCGVGNAATKTTK